MEKIDVISKEVLGIFEKVIQRLIVDADGNLSVTQLEKLSRCYTEYMNVNKLYKNSVNERKRIYEEILKQILSILTSKWNIILQFLHEEIQEFNLSKELSHRLLDKLSLIIEQILKEELSNFIEKEV